MNDLKANRRFGIRIFLGLLFLVFAIGFFAWKTQESPYTAVKAQLEAVSDKRLTEAYYSYTSKDFQEATSLDSFKKFVQYFPVFFEDYKLSLEAKTKDDQADQVKAVLEGKGEKIELLFTIGKQDAEWKVHGIRAMNEKSPKELPEFDETVFQVAIQKQLEALQLKQNKKAYEEYTAEAFQDTTTLKEFNEFIEGFPIFSQFKKMNFAGLSFVNNIGIYEVQLTSAQGDVYNLKYDLIKDKGAWKIIQIEIDADEAKN